MPLERSTYQPSGIYKVADVNTIYAATLRKVELKPYERERISLEDGDFLDLDWSFSEDRNSKKLVIILHGLAGSSDRPYMKGMARIFNRNGWNTVAMNFRGCSEELNRHFKSYHGGATDDLQEVIDHVLKTRKYESIGMIGFSLGGNVVLKYLGEKRNFPPEIKAAVTVSVPCDLAGSLGEINKTRNFIYSKRFELKLKSHLLSRAKKFPERLTKKEVEACNSLRDIDELYTSKAHGFESAEEYYRKNSSLHFLESIHLPTLLINARDDSFLCNSSYPVKLAEASKYLHLEVPDHGGHVGFALSGPEFYHEKKALEFLEKAVDTKY
jgi:predicted alpha/beta-fold hydrolase